MSSWALIPVKPPPDRKTRLAGLLDEPAREALVRRMAAHVVAAAGAAPGIDTVAVVGAGDVALPGGAAQRAEVTLIPDPDAAVDEDRGLNAALRAAIAHAGAAGAHRVVIVAGDLPRVAPTEIALLAAVAGEAIALAPDRHGVGTNALSLPLPLAADFALAYGRDSYAAHRAEAGRLGLDVVEVMSEGLARDVDLPEDLADAAELA